MGVICGLGWLLVAGALVAPLVGIGLALAQPGSISTALVDVPPPVPLLLHSLLVCAIATCVAILLALVPAGVLGTWSGLPARRRLRRLAPMLWGLVLAPLLVPPQTYAYAWRVATAPDAALGSVLPGVASLNWLGASIRAGLISGGWLWPVAAMILAAGWRSMGAGVFALALIDTSPTRALLRAVVPSLRAHLAAAAALVFAITLIEYPIPHLSFAKVYATELLVLVDANAPPGQVVHMAARVAGLLAIVAVVAGWSLRAVRHWGGEDAEPPATMHARLGWAAALASAAIWAATVGLPVVVMWRALRVRGAWLQGFRLFAEQWQNTLLAACAAAGIAVLVATATAVMAAAARGGWRKWVPAGGAVLSMVAAVIPPAALGIGLIMVFNRPVWGQLCAPGAALLGRVLGGEAWEACDLYRDTPIVWALALAARYSAVVVLIVWLALRKRAIPTAEQAMADGAGQLAVAGHVLLPIIWPSLLAGAVITTILSGFEVVVTQLVQPVGYPSVSLALLGQMHYGRDDVVITTSLLIIAAGVLLTQACAWLLMKKL